MLLPQHYALSEAVIVATGSIAVFRARSDRPWLALGLAPFILAGLIGTVRIGFALENADLTALHQSVSRLGGLFGLGSLVGALWRQRVLDTVLLGLAALAAGWLAPALVVVLFITLSLAGAGLIWRQLGQNKWLNSFGFLLLVSAKLGGDSLRETHPDLAWHFFHLMVALWVWNTAITLTNDQTQTTSPPMRKS
jgi:hypothetical protein